MISRYAMVGWFGVYALTAFGVAIPSSNVILGVLAAIIAIALIVGK